MNMVQVINGQIAAYSLPETGTLKDGSTVSGYHLLPAEVLKSEGWLPLVDEQPTYNKITQQLEHNGYTIGANSVLTNYKIVDNQIIKPQPTSENYLIELDYRLSKLELGVK